MKTQRVFWKASTALALAVAQAFFLHAKANLEERLLRAQFPGYSEYARQVPRFLPRLLPR